jgi:RNA polymerase subunit RPABC4/transcription elongation factor Spt4
LLQQAKEIGLIDSNLTVTCYDCRAIFPKEYGNCPQCQTKQSLNVANFNISVNWEQKT